MKMICAWCRQELATGHQIAGDLETDISHGICPSCKDYCLSGRRPTMDQFLDRSAAPVLVVDPQGEILFANKHALGLLGKDLEGVRGYKGGDAMECAYARLPGGCGRTEHCKACTIRNSVVETFNTGQSLLRVPAYLNRRTDDGTVRIRFLISTQKVDNTVFLRVDQVGQ